MKMRSRKFPLANVAATVVLAITAAACGGSGNASTPASSPAATSVSGPAATSVSGPTATSVSGGAVDPNAPEVVEPGDIPDNQVFIAFAPPGASFSVDVPEGWARTESAGAVTFTDKYNSIVIDSTPAAVPPTVESVTATGLSDVSGDPTFHLIDVQPVTRSAGDGILATYEIGSEVNPVTGKRALLAVERYVFFHNGTDVVLTLSGAKGADNVDPWKIVSESLTWT